MRNVKWSQLKSVKSVLVLTQYFEKKNDPVLVSFLPLLYHKVSDHGSWTIYPSYTEVNLLLFDLIFTVAFCVRVEVLRESVLTPSINMLINLTDSFINVTHLCSLAVNLLHFMVLRLQSRQVPVGSHTACHVMWTRERGVCHRTGFSQSICI